MFRYRQGRSALVLLVACAGVFACSSDEGPGSGAQGGGGSTSASTGSPSSASTGSGGAAPSTTTGTGGNGGSGGSGGSSGNDKTGDCTSVNDKPVIVVNKDGSGTFTSVQAALNSVSKSNKTQTIIRIAPGSYAEKLLVDRPFVTLCGEVGKEKNTILTYNDSASTPNGNGGTLGTTGSASVNISASDVSAENITFQNSTGPGIQAVALLVTGSRVQFPNSRFMGYQDTLYVKGGTQYFRDCFIAGSVDFIFGGATAVFDNCTTHNAAGGTAIVAPSTDQAVPYGIVFLGGSATADPAVETGSVALGRNWKA